MRCFSNSFSEQDFQALVVVQKVSQSYGSSEQHERTLTNLHPMLHGDTCFWLLAGGFKMPPHVRRFTQLLGTEMI